MTEQGDHELVQLMANGESHALGTLYDRHGGIAYGLAYRITGDRLAAEEAVQDAFLQVWKRADTFDPDRGAGFRAWLLTIVHHRAVDLVRHRAGHGKREVELPSDAPYIGDADPSVEVIANLERDNIRGVLATLPTDQRETIELAYFGGLTHHEIAERSGLPLGTVKGRLRLGLRKMHQGLTAGGATMDRSAGGWGR